MKKFILGMLLFSASAATMAQTEKPSPVVQNSKVKKHHVKKHLTMKHAKKTTPAKPSNQ